MIGDELRRQADNFIELDDLREVLGRPMRTDSQADAWLNKQVSDTPTPPKNLLHQDG